MSTRRRTNARWNRDRIRLARHRSIDSSPRLTARTPSVRSTHRLLFGIDATASRQPTWDLACELHAELFAEAARARQHRNSVVLLPRPE